MSPRFSQELLYLKTNRCNVDPQVGAEANCTKNICCRNFVDQNGAIPTVPAGPNGNQHCDSPVPLADSMLEAIQRFGTEARFAIFTGDVVEDKSFSLLSFFTYHSNALMNVPHG